MDDPQLQRKRQIFYRDFADGTFRFKDGKIIRANKGILSSKSEILHKLITDSSDGIIDIPEYDKEDFELFLDCLMGFKKCDFNDALKILPIAMKYETKKLIDKCSAVLTPTPTLLDKKITLALNLVASDKTLVAPILKFLKENRLLYKFMEDEEYFLSLEPEAMYAVLDEMPVDSVILKNVFKWGEAYLKKRNEKIDLKSFFAKHNIDDCLDLSCFESAKCYFDFNKSDIGKNFFTFIDEYDYVKFVKYDPRRSEWVKIKAGETLTEELTVLNVAHLSDHTTKIVILENKIIFYDFPEDETSIMVTYDYSYYFENFEGGEVLKYNGVCQKFDFINESSPLNGSPTILKINFKKNVVSSLIIKIEYNFKYDCRILKTSPKYFDNVKFKPRNKLFFTLSVKVRHEK